MCSAVMVLLFLFYYLFILNYEYIEQLNREFREFMHII